MHVFTDIFQFFVAHYFKILTSMGKREKNMETRQIYARYVQYNQLHKNSSNTVPTYLNEFAEL